MKRYIIFSKDDPGTTILLLADDWQEAVDFCKEEVMPPWPHDGPTIYQYDEVFGELINEKRIGRFRDLNIKE